MNPTTVWISIVQCYQMLSLYIYQNVPVYKFLIVVEKRIKGSLVKDILTREERVA
ncbi:hypothetical protein STAPHY8AQ_20360 [Staphylococcus sp. 8AQ]|nr:hypothetical protein STAPHY8AQ_20360 [Staphylococcus sp. 8AQ]